MYVLSIEFVWVEIYGKIGENHHFWAFSRFGIVEPLTRQHIHKLIGTITEGQLS